MAGEEAAAAAGGSSPRQRCRSSDRVAPVTGKVDTTHMDMVSCLTMTATTYISRRMIVPMHGIGVRTHVRR